MDERFDVRLFLSPAAGENGPVGVCPAAQFVSVGPRLTVTATIQSASAAFILSNWPGSVIEREVLGLPSRLYRKCRSGRPSALLHAKSLYGPSCQAAWLAVSLARPHPARSMCCSGRTTPVADAPARAARPSRPFRGETGPPSDCKLPSPRDRQGHHEVHWSHDDVCDCGAGVASEIAKEMVNIKPKSRTPAHARRVAVVVDHAPDPAHRF